MRWKNNTAALLVPFKVAYKVVKHAFVLPAMTGINMMLSPMYNLFCLSMGVVVIYGARVIVGMALDRVLTFNLHPFNLWPLTFNPT